jgi:hypothetical protein
LGKKPYGIKLRCYYRKHLEGQLGNLRSLIGTSWEHIGNNRKKGSSGQLWKMLSPKGGR